MRIAKRIRRLIEDKNRLFLADVLIQLGTGMLFSFLIYGFLFMLALFLSGVSISVFDKKSGLSPVSIAMIVVGLYFAVATWSAWRRVDPFRGVKKMTDRQKLLTMISQMTPHTLYFSPKHASAAFASLLLGGPVNFFTAWGTWKNRYPTNAELIDDAAEMMKGTTKGLPIDQVTSVEAALLLRRLGLITVTKQYEGEVIEPTEKGRKLLARKI
ncbi:hypothetical protein MNBD_PLANCTO02-158 [hydrothermal vent metagenome]|uniref:Uncharacterized protein n=1 Tax=hydrothermal vent metagenome TaxID=652676 RepID=A0A3B1DZI1_9ZZZZ